ncbi:MAG TPA: rhodanese-like domain-containing protein [Candidatus Nitrosopolaris sp.]|nr:rhodanese-like domain-containing protein [Candidatus Nitrosopolaris sp.]
MITIDANWLVSHLDCPDVVILDARGIVPYRFRHIRNSRPLGLDGVILVAESGANLVIDPSTAEKLFSTLGICESRKVIVYGESTDPSAARVVWTLMYHGHPDVKLLNISFSQWENAGFPVTREVVPAQGQDEKASGPNGSDVSSPIFKSKINPTIRADADYIKTRQVDPNVVIVDARTPQEHFQARIPGSILDNWEGGIGQNGKMIKSMAELEAGFESKGITKNKEIICYCHVGIRASHKYLQLKQAGYDRVKVYDGSIIDWAQRRNLLR